MELPIVVRNRPFSIEPITSMMMPDGIFDTSLRFQEISFFVTNRSKHRLSFCQVRPNRHSTTEWVYSQTHMTQLGPMEPGESRLVRWLANFSSCTPGKKILQIEYGAQIDWDRPGGGFDGVFDKQIFVCRTTATLDKNKFICEVPEGKLQLEIQNFSLIKGWTYVDSYSDIPTDVTLPSFPIIEKIRGIVQANPGYEDSIPFQDPWWKVVAWIIAAVAAIGAVIAAKEGQGTVSIGVSGDFNTDNGNSNWCIPDPTKNPDHENLAGYLSILAGAAIRVGMMDERDPWQKGRDKLPNDPQDPRRNEILTVSIETPNSLAAGTKWVVPTDWEYQSITKSGVTATETRSEVGASENFANSTKITLPPQVTFGEDLVVNVYLEDSLRQPLSGDEMYAFANFVAPNGHIFKFDLKNTELGSRKVLVAGNFQAGLNTEWAAGQIGTENVKGRWRVDLFGQLVNRAPSNIPPFEAAKYVGGDFLLGPIKVSKIRPDDEEGGETDTAKCEPDTFLETEVV